ncbi:hypothetical protein J1614_002974 [Plenodomus biglobosus]|nr:hypothetical protein J1614_002974 [Plenodomus biglobosus]
MAQGCQISNARHQALQGLLPARLMLLSGEKHVLAEIVVASSQVTRAAGVSLGMIAITTQPIPGPSQCAFAAL